MLSYLPMIPASFEGWGRYGLECKTRKCTYINMGPDENPTSLNPKEKIGSVTPAMAIVLLVLFNGAIFYRLWVHHFNSAI